MEDDYVGSPEYIGKFAYVSGARGRAVIRIEKSDISGVGDRNYLFVDSANVLAGEYEFPAAFRVNEIEVFDTVDEPRERFLKSLRAEREILYAQITTLNIEIAMAEVLA